MILILASAALSVTAIDAERAFARDARIKGQWAAFRKWSDHDAVMFVPKAVWARDFLKDRKEPRQALAWWPRESITSCDGKVAVNDGPWSGPGRSHGRFTTVWLKKPEGWRWVYDGGETLPTATAARARAVTRRVT